MRLLKPVRRSEKLRGLRAHTGSPAGWVLRLGGRLAVAGLVAALIGVVISGNDGGRTGPPGDTSSNHNDHD